MKRTDRFTRWMAGLGTACLLAFSSLAVHADAGSLRDKYTQLQEQLRSNPYGRQLHIDSSEAGQSLQGDIYAVLDHPYGKVKEALQDPDAWCDIMMLPFNTKSCQAGGGRLAVGIVRKADQPWDRTYGLDLGFRRAASGPGYLETRLNAGSGPFGTRDYRIVAEAIPLDDGHTFMHLSYAYAYGGMGRFAMQAYLATAGASKVGFTAGGMRGAIERNAMRYYLAIDAYLDTMDLPAGQRVEQRIQKWFSATERYPRQLHEMDRGTYVALKRQEYGAQETASAR